MSPPKKTTTLIIGLEEDEEEDEEEEQSQVTYAKKGKGKQNAATVARERWAADTTASRYRIPQLFIDEVQQEIDSMFAAQKDCKKINAHPQVMEAEAKLFKALILVDHGASQGSPEINALLPKPSFFQALRVITNGAVPTSLYRSLYALGRWNITMPVHEKRAPTEKPQVEVAISAYTDQSLNDMAHELAQLPTMEDLEKCVKENVTKLSNDHFSQAIQSSQTALEKRCDGMEEEFKILQTRQTQLEEKMDKFEAAMQRQEEISFTKSDLVKTQNKIQAEFSKVFDMNRALTMKVSSIESMMSSQKDIGEDDGSLLEEKPLEEKMEVVGDAAPNDEGQVPDTKKDDDDMSPILKKIQNKQLAWRAKLEHRISGQECCSALPLEDIARTVGNAGSPANTNDRCITPEEAVTTPNLADDGSLTNRWRIFRGITTMGSSDGILGLKRSHSGMSESHGDNTLIKRLRASDIRVLDADKGMHGIS
ncbi:hypothetical protein PT974_10840 [Cladobotryum mycophilum]|uniref:Uncharacterized protein n=1 Tax=Cladobotryum mycophilum TaxID=491253 RepID=A0ABR0SBZ4_9HYPO